MTAIDWAALIEAAATVLDDSYSRWCDRVEDEPFVPETEHEAMAEAALPVIARELLAPLRELHHAKAYTCTHLRTPGELGPCCRHEICVACNQMHPCPTVRLLDQIESDVKGGER